MDVFVEDVWRTSHTGEGQMKWNERKRDQKRGHGGVQRKKEKNFVQNKMEDCEDLTVVGGGLWRTVQAGSREHSKLSSVIGGGGGERKLGASTQDKKFSRNHFWIAVRTATHLHTDRSAKNQANWAWVGDVARASRREIGWWAPSWCEKKETKKYWHYWICRI